jgi:hypothetical protein
MVIFAIFLLFSVILVGLDKYSFDLGKNDFGKRIKVVCFPHLLFFLLL